MFNKFLTLLKYLLRETEHGETEHSETIISQKSDVLMYRSALRNSKEYFPVLLADNINDIFWLICECPVDFSGSPLDKYIVSQSWRLNWATMVNIVQPTKSELVDGKWKIEWDGDIADKWNNRPIKPIRQFLTEGYTNNKLKIPELIKILDEFFICVP